MKKIFCLLMVWLLIFMLTACSDVSDSAGNNVLPATNSVAEKLFVNAEEAYVWKQGDIRNNVSEEYINNYLRYFYKDIDGNGINEMCVTDGNDMSLTVYTYQNGYLQKIGSKEFGTATTRCFSSSNSKYPGIFIFSVGGGAEHYSYMSISEGEIVFEKLWDNMYMSKTTEEFVLDKEIIKESLSLHQKGEDIAMKEIMG